MLFRQLDYFVALAREGQPERAAEQCCVSPLALTAALTKLEHELDVTLFDRKNNFEQLTPAGERLLRWAKRILAEHDSFKAELGALRSGVTGTLRVAISPAASTTAALVLSAFCSTHPLVKVEMRSRLTNTELYRRLKDSEVDASITRVSPEHSRDLDLVPMCEERYVLLAPANILTGDPSTLRWPEVAELPLVLLTPDMQARQVIDAAFAEHGIVVKPQVETDSVASLFVHVATGDWASIIPHTWLWTTLTVGDLRAVELVDPTASAEIAVITGTKDSVSPLAREFVECAEKLALNDFFDQRMLVGV
jgi:DNA-binding transcriptional LysR family regulator